MSDFFPERVISLAPNTPCDDNPAICRLYADYVIITIAPNGKHYRHCVCKPHKQELMMSNKQVYSKFYVYRKGELISIQ